MDKMRTNQNPPKIAEDLAQAEESTDETDSDEDDEDEAGVKNEEGVEEQAEEEEERKEEEVEEEEEEDSDDDDAFGANCSSIEITITCKDLENKDAGDPNNERDKSDPLCVIYHRLPNQKTWIELMKTETQENNLSPKFHKKVEYEYRFETSQTLLFHVYDVDDLSAPLLDEDSLGFHECTVATIVLGGTNGYTNKLQSVEGRKIPGTINLLAQEKAAMQDKIYLELRGSNVYSCLSCICGKTFYAVSRQSKNPSRGEYKFSHCYKSPAIRSQHPRWEPMDSDFGRLCHGDENRPLRLEVWRKGILGTADQLIGHAMTTLHRLFNSTDELWTTCVKLTTPKEKPGTASLTIISCFRSPVFTFMDFMQAGTKISMCFCLDFSTKSGLTTSKHHGFAADFNFNSDSDLQDLDFKNKKNFQNPFEEILVGADIVMKQYSPSNSYKVYGFGATCRNSNQENVSPQCFNLSMEESPDLEGVEGVQKAFMKCIEQIQQVDINTFAPCITTVSNLASAVQDGSNYFVICILTYDVMSDFNQTKEAIVKASGLPISIVFVALGDPDLVDFGALINLSGGKQKPLLIFNGRKARRDMVRFVRYKTGDTLLMPNGDEFPLVRRILAPIPDQIADFMYMKDIEPGMIPRKEEATDFNSEIDIDLDGLPQDRPKPSRDFF